MGSVTELKTFSFYPIDDHAMPEFHDRTSTFFADQFRLFNRPPTKTKLIKCTQFISNFQQVQFLATLNGQTLMGN